MRLGPSRSKEEIDEEDSSFVVLYSQALHPKLVQRHEAEDAGYQESKWAGRSRDKWRSTGTGLNKEAQTHTLSQVSIFR